MRLEGSLDAFSLPDIFSLLSMTKKTGGLHLRRAAAHGVVWLTDGAVTGGSSELSRATLARRVAGTGQVPDEQLRDAVATVSDELGIARALRDGGAVDEGLLHSVVSEHVVDTVFDLLRWPDGDFEFVVNEPNPDDIGLARTVDEVVAEARSRLESWAGVAERVPSPDTVLSLVLAPETDPSMSRDEWAVLALIDGQRSVGELVALCGRGEYAVVGTLAELVSRGLVSADGDGVAALVGRQQLLRSLEGTAEAAAPDPVAPKVDEAAVPVDDLDLDVEIVEMDDGDADEATEADAHEDEDEDEDEDDEPIGRVQRLSPVPGQGRDLAVTPARPEPFLPARQPDHPEPGPVAAVAGGGVATAPSTAIERDPSVNKSLLLRLIAGVRGL